MDGDVSPRGDPGLDPQQGFDAACLPPKLRHGVDPWRGQSLSRQRPPGSPESGDADALHPVDHRRSQENPCPVPPQGAGGKVKTSILAAAGADGLHCWYMTGVAQIESAIEKLSAEELKELAKWFDEYQLMVGASAEIFSMYDEEERAARS